MPPKATAMKPALVKKLPASNCSDMIGATTAPPVAPISAASPKLKRVNRATSTPMKRAASGFSAQAVSALPSAVCVIRSQMPDDDDAGKGGDPQSLGRHQNAEHINRLLAGERGDGVGLAAPDHERQTVDEGQKPDREHQHAAGGQARQRRYKGRSAKDQAQSGRGRDRREKGYGQRPAEIVREGVECERTNDAEAALHQIDNAGDAIDKADAKGDDRKDAALQYAADQNLRELVHRQRASPQSPGA